MHDLAPARQAPPQPGPQRAGLRALHGAAAGTVLGLCLLAGTAQASSDDAWESFRAEVAETCRTLAQHQGDAGAALTVEVNPFGSEHFGLALVTAQLPPDTNGRRPPPERMGCIFDKQARTAELTGAFNPPADEAAVEAKERAAPASPAVAPDAGGKPLVEAAPVAGNPVAAAPVSAAATDKSPRPPARPAEVKATPVPAQPPAPAPAQAPATAPVVPAPAAEAPVAAPLPAAPSGN